LPKVPKIEKEGNAGWGETEIIRQDLQDGQDGFPLSGREREKPQPLRGR
jgi:hypothetical protein